MGGFIIVYATFLKKRASVSFVISKKVGRLGQKNIVKSTQEKGKIILNSVIHVT